MLSGKTNTGITSSLPQGVMPSYIQYMDTIQKLEKQGIKVKISDISDAMNLPRPGVTRTVKEMEAKGYLHKFASKEDGRVTYIAITEEGRSCPGNMIRTISVSWLFLSVIFPRKMRIV